MGFFVLFLILLLVIGGKVFDLQKVGDLKETTRAFIKVLSLIMCLYLNIASIPMFSVIFQGFKCNDGYPGSLSEVSCTGVTHDILILFSVVLFILYIGFITLESILYTTNSFENYVPWASIDRGISLIKILEALVIALCLVLDQEGSFKGQSNLICMVIEGVIVYRRYKKGFMFEDSVYYAAIAYECLQLWLYFTVAIHILLGKTISIASLAVMVAAGLAMAAILIADLMKTAKVIKIKDDIGGFEEPMHLITFFYESHRVIQSGKKEAMIILLGKLRKHSDDCRDKACICLDMLQTLDENQKLRELLDSFAFKNITNTTKYGQTNAHPSALDVGTVPQIQSTKDNCNPNSLSIDGVPMSERHDLQDKTIENLIDGSNTPHFIAGPNILNTDLKSGPISFHELSHQQSTTPKLKQESTFNQRESNFNGGRGADESQIYAIWLEKRRRLMQLEEGINRIFENQVGKETQTTYYYQLLAMMIKEAIEKFPVNVELRIIHAFVQKEKLSNEFKAIFEMMNSELSNPTIFEQFVIFRKKIEVEQTLIKSYQKNILKVGTIDVQQIFKYEKLFQKYQLYEYLATYSAQCFWRELMGKQVNASVLQEKGSLISKFYEQIQDIAKELLVIYPNEIKFFFRYGNFLMYIIHNEFDALEQFQMAYNVYQMRLAKKGNSMPINEQSIFGENTAAAIVIISATSSKIGTIIHCNDEIENVLKYKRSEIIGKNVKILVPRPIALVHDRLIQRYFETAKPNVIEIKRQLFGVTKEGYLQEVELVVKVLPQVNDKILFVGFIQRVDYFDDMESPSGDFDKLDKQYLVTDWDGNITNVTEGLMIDLGLHAKFFNYSDSIFEQMFNIQQICTEIIDPSLQYQLETEGKSMIFDTQSILSSVELEQLNADEILEIKSNLGQYHIYVQCKRLIVSVYCKLCIYRLIILGKQGEYNPSQKAFKISAMSKDGHGNPQSGLQQDGSGSNDDTYGGLMGNTSSLSASMSSTSTNRMSFNRVIKDFKKALGERKTPRNLVILSRIVGAIIIGIIILTSINFSQLAQETQSLHEGKEQNLLIESRSLKFVQLASNIRSLVNIANHLEFEEYFGQILRPIDRFQYLQRLIMTQSSDLQSIHQQLSKKRQKTSSVLSGRSQDYDKMQSDYEYLPIPLFRLDESNKVSTYDQPFRSALITYLNFVLTLNGTDSSQLSFPKSLLYRPQYENQTVKINESTSQLQKGVFFLVANGYKSLRMHARDATTFFQKSYFEEIRSNPFLAVTLIGIILSLLITGFIIYQVWLIERNKVHILCLYTHLQMTEIDTVYNSCMQFMAQLNSGSLISRQCIGEERDVSDTITPISQIGSGAFRSINAQKSTSQVLVVANEGGGNQLSIGLSGLLNSNNGFLAADNLGSKQLMIPSLNDQRKYGSIISEEEKEQHEQKILLEKKRLQRIRENRKSRSPLGGQEIYQLMIKVSMDNVRQMIEKDDQTKIQRQRAIIGRNMIALNRTNNSLVAEDEGAVDMKASHQKGNTDSKQPIQKVHQKGKGGKDRKKRAKEIDDGVFEEEKDSSHRFQAQQKRTSVTNSTHQHHHKKYNKEDQVVSSQIGESSKIQRRSDTKKHQNDDSKEASSDEEIEKIKKTSKIFDEEEVQYQIKKEDNEEQSSNFDAQLYDEEAQERRAFFVSTIRNNYWGKISIIVIVGLVFCTYFLQLYIYNGNFKSYITHIQDAIPIFLGRFRHSMLAFAVLRERILYNNTLDYLELTENNGYNLDIQKIQDSIQNERHLTELKVNHKSIIQGMLDFLNVADSEAFCSNIVSSDQVQQGISSNELPELQDNIPSEKVKIARPYESLVQSIVQAQIAAIQGNVNSLKALKDKMVDLNAFNYDKRTPLHFAAKYGNYEAVQYLIQMGVSVNPIDRWNATPLTYAWGNPKISSFLISVGGKNGTDNQNAVLLNIYFNHTLSEDGYRSFYAAYFDDIDSLKILNMQKKLQVNAFDQDGRTALGIAASQGSLRSVKYLIYRGADLAMRDARFHNAVYYAKLEDRDAVVDYLELRLNERTILNYCYQFQDGLLSKGMQQAVGNFHKRFADVEIKMNSPHNRTELLALLGEHPPNLIITQPTTHEIFFSCQELYYSEVIDKMIDKIREVFNEYLDTYSSNTQILFLVFLAFQILMLFYLRENLIRHMCEDVFKIRGILNLIPDSFFEQNRTKVEKLIRNLKD